MNDFKIVTTNAPEQGRQTQLPKTTELDAVAPNVGLETGHP